MTVFSNRVTNRTHALLMVSALGLGLVAAGSTRAAAQAQGATKPKAELSASQQLSVARGVVSRGQDLAQRLMHMVDEARREGDVIKLTCLNDTLTQTNANVTTAQSRLEALSKAVDADSRGHEFTVITVIGQKLQTLDQEGNQCVGQDLYETGTTKTETDIDESMLPFDNSSNETPVLLPPGVPSVPPRSSPVK